jgi:UDP-N-acetylmuramate: L-alanyl-gamma-D-glutamyl-meso-diaminopimelate ligase
MAVNAALFAGLTPAQAREGLLQFEGVARRQEWKGEARGVTVVDDFAHHPTAIQLAIAAMRQRYQGARLWVIFEPRSNTTKRKVFQTELAQALATADLAVVAAIADLHKVPVDERLDPDQLSRDIAQFGGQSWYLSGVDAIIDLVAEQAQSGDVVAVLSNGGFGGIHQKLLDRLAAGI